MSDSFESRRNDLRDELPKDGIKCSRDRGPRHARSHHEYFLGMFAAAEGKLGGEYYTSRSVVRVLVEMLAPYAGRVFDPACGSGGMFVQCERLLQD